MPRVPQNPRPKTKARGAPRARQRLAPPIFVIQKHAARRLHYDLRLEVDGLLKSWAVPKGPSLNPKDRRLAVQVQDHPLAYADFEGLIAEGREGAGAVIVWDKGTYRNLTRDKNGNAVPMHKALAQGRVEIWLEGQKLRGGYALVRTKMPGEKQNWLLIKRQDEWQDAQRDPTQTEPWSVLSGRTLEALTNQTHTRRED